MFPAPDGKKVCVRPLLFVIMSGPTDFFPEQTHTWVSETYCIHTCTHTLAHTQRHTRTHTQAQTLCLPFCYMNDVILNGKCQLLFTLKLIICDVDLNRIIFSSPNHVLCWIPVVLYYLSYHSEQGNSNVVK